MFSVNRPVLFYLHIQVISLHTCLSSKIIRYIKGNFSFSVQFGKFTEFFQYNDFFVNLPSAAVVKWVERGIPALIHIFKWLNRGLKYFGRYTILYLAPKISGILAEKLDQNVSVNKALGTGSQRLFTERFKET